MTVSSQNYESSIHDSDFHVLFRIASSSFLCEFVCVHVDFQIQFAANHDQEGVEAFDPYHAHTAHTLLPESNFRFVEFLIHPACIPQKRRPGKIARARTIEKPVTVSWAQDDVAA